ncbi:MAG: sulfatase-like hydrolase/transferase, partial [Fuerstiella sp.]
KVARYADVAKSKRQGKPAYAAMVESVDDSVGRVLKTLRQLKLDDRTLVIFTSDNGGFAKATDNSPLRANKGSNYEGGIRVPAMISWPKVIPASAVRHQMVTACDWLPTLVSLCDLDAGKRKFDGKDISDVLQSANAQSPHKVFHWESGGGKKNRQWAVRKGDWKLIGNPNDTSKMAPITNDDRRFLVNLSDSVHELENLAAQHPDVVRELEQLHNEWIRDVSQH